MKNKNKTQRILAAINQTRGRYMALSIATSKYSQTISCKKIAVKDKSIVVQDRNDRNRNRVIAMESLQGVRCGDIEA